MIDVPSSENYTSLNTEEALFLHQIKQELSLDDSNDAVPLVASVLQALRQTLSIRTAEMFLQKLPGFFKMLYAYNWKPSENQNHVVVEHLDELVTLVMERDQKNKKSLFKSEIQALSVILLTLKKVYTLIDLRACDGISYIFYQELRQASAEMAAA